MKVLITGANGFIGKHLVKSLESQVININVFVRDRSECNTLKHTNVFKGDILQKSESLTRAIEGSEYVFHLIAKTHDLTNREDNIKDYFKINVEGTINLLDQCINSQIKHFIFFSSIKVFAEESEHVLDETFSPEPTTPYGQSKLEAENLVIEYGKKYKFKTTVVRLPLVYGPGNKGNVYRIMKAIDNGRFIMVGRGENRRSMVYVGNVVDAALKIAGREEADGKVYIVTDDIDYTVKQLYETISKGLSKKVLPLYLPLGIARSLAFAGDLSGYIVRHSLPFNTDVLKKLTGSLRFSSRKLQDEIGFKPRYTLSNTINETVQWYRENQ